MFPATDQLEQGIDFGDARNTMATPLWLSMCLAFAGLLSGCGNSTPARPTPIADCTSVVITIGRFTNGAPPSPGQGMVWTSYFGGTILTAADSVYVVDVTYASPACLTNWTAVSADRNAVQVSPASGQGRGQVELFIVGNGGAQRSTLVTIAGQTASITQAGR